MLKVCPECRRLSVEFDPHQSVERCLSRQCGWVNREGKALTPESEKLASFRFSRTMEKRVRQNSKETNAAD